MTTKLLFLLGFMFVTTSLFSQTRTQEQYKLEVHEKEVTTIDSLCTLTTTQKEQISTYHLNYLNQLDHLAQQNLNFSAFTNQRKLLFIAYRNSTQQLLPKEEFDKLVQHFEQKKSVDLP